MLEVKRIKPEDTYHLRHTILRPSQPFEACKYDADYAEDTFHVGAFYQGNLITIASFYKEKHPDLLEDNQFRLRAMATDVAFRKLGAGRLVVSFAVEIVKQKNHTILWCNGRTSVQGYYERLGFQAHGEVFDLPPIGEHIVMVKRLE
ncbi:GNAT family N-acetyltransferase [Ornithinibacillus scapharcae]|uniref:GNAT family N-acetyltransferase n=1 Tax=Ornithinibacillus scapharcae TaxID=1147159 RepID=UPI000225AA73|nr:GNAT family N-acetyltransferase [Ornithinibacillus scapharcae]